MRGITVNFDGLKQFVTEEEYNSMKSRVRNAHELLENKNGAGKDFLGWLDLPKNITDEEINHIKTCAEKIRTQAEVLVVVGIGGSYLGAKAVIDALSNPLYNLQSAKDRCGPQILFAGNNLSGTYMRSLFEYLEDKDFSINVISKSGTTLEPAVAFRMLKLFAEEKYGIGGAAERIYVTTDKENGVLKQIAEKEGYEQFVIPQDVGGRYSVLTPVGLLPIAVAGIEFEDIIDGALLARKMYGINRIEDNDCYKYAAYRNILHSRGKDIEIMAAYEPSMQYFIEWYKQLFGESEGKNQKGIFPAGTIFTTDLHSMGQLIQDGKRNIFETVINVTIEKGLMKVPHIDNAIDGLDYIEGKDLDYINSKAQKGTYDAHIAGRIPVIEINIKELNAYTMGQLIYFFEKACAVSGYILGVNPFDQPGVELYKKNMMKLLKGGN